jgi:hypothetical protein
MVCHRHRRRWSGGRARLRESRPRSATEGTAPAMRGRPRSANEAPLATNATAPATRGRPRSASPTPRSGRVAGRDRAGLPGKRDVQPSARVARLPAVPVADPPGPGPAPDVHGAWLPAPRYRLRLRAHRALPAGWPDLRMQRRAMLPSPSSRQASRRVAAVPAAPGHLRLDNAARAQPPDRSRALPDVTRAGRRASPGWDASRGWRRGTGPGPGRQRGGSARSTHRCAPTSRTATTPGSRDRRRAARPRR